MGDRAGHVEYVEPDRLARIEIVSQQDFERGSYTITWDFERVLVHELLHLKFSLLDESGNDLQDRVVHQMIDDLARALVCAKRHTIRIGLKNEQL